MKKDKKITFNTPEGYFEKFNDRLMDRIQSEEAEDDEDRDSIIPKTDGFLVPKGYFDEFEPIILSKTSQKETKVIPLRSNRKWYYGVAAIAAIFTLIFSKTQRQNLSLLMIWPMPS
nr:hypothetical protein [uncultured Allomuricauda sp.]